MKSRKPYSRDIDWLNKKRCMCILDFENLFVSGVRVGRWEINCPGNLSRHKDGTFAVPRETPVRLPDKSHAELASTVIFLSKIIVSALNSNTGLQVKERRLKRFLRIIIIVINIII